MKPVAVVMNVFYTGLGIARSLGERGVRVIGLTAQRRVYGNFTRHAKTVFAPDSRSEPDALLTFLTQLGRELGGKSVLFPTRDDDVLFLNRFRKELEPYFSLVIPGESALSASLNKWETFLAAKRAKVATPGAWMIEGLDDLERAAAEIRYPCVLKPLSAHHWRQGGNWELVGARKAIGIASEEELRAEYHAIARADSRALVQEMVPGGDDCLLIAACYMNRESRWVAGFNTQKILQIPEGFGTGCIVQCVDRSELFAPTIRLLQSIGYSGIAEVEYKWDAAAGEYMLIEINSRPWDQHRLGHACGVELMYFAYCEHAGLPMPAPVKPALGHKWIAEDTFVTAAIRSFGNGKPGLGTLLRLARGKRTYAIWSVSDPFPSIIYWMTRFLPDLIVSSVRALWSAIAGEPSVKVNLQKKEIVYETHAEKQKSLR
jgi:predicted ATP-grasp superfamily ATP-dependent carboligase